MDVERGGGRTKTAFETIFSLLMKEILQVGKLKRIKSIRDIYPLKKRVY